ncbi:hypothetical protein EK904_001646 [Melospiza melodia maxima]|nr:hypothetical protein EK904_001646 [Melospiza melodia maxima]
MKLHRLLADGRAQVDLQPCAPQPAPLLCAGCPPAQEESRSFPCSGKSSVYVSNTFFKVNEKWLIIYRLRIFRPCKAL